jgi:nicotinamidase-related amidase
VRLEYFDTQGVRLEMIGKVSGRSVLVIVDVQNGFVSDATRHIVPIISRLAERWLDAGRDVIFTRYVNYAGSPFERNFSWSAMKASPEIDIVDALSECVRRATAVIDKGLYTMFTAAGSSVVSDHGWTDLHICGIDTEACVLKIAVDAFERNLTPWIIADASASDSGREYHNAGLLVAKKLIGVSQIVTASDTI